jgi:hypothetical protein
MSKLKIASAIAYACAVATAVLAVGAAVHFSLYLEAKAPKAVDTTAVYTTHKISYAFLETRPYTNRYGGICGADTYLHCGVIQDDGSIKEETEDVDYVTIKYSDEDYSYKANFYDRTTYDNGSFGDRYTSTVYYLTDEMMRDLGTGGSI